MAATAPQAIPFSQNTSKWRPVIDTSCRVMCPECYVQTTATGIENDGTRYGCPMCGLVFTVEWGA